MTPQEFKAWFDGFTEGLDGAPNEKQWKRIKAKVADINGSPVSYPVYIDRYLLPSRQRYTGIVWDASSGAMAVGGAVSSCNALRTSAASEGTARRADAVAGFDSLKALYAVGKMEAEEVAA